MIKHLNDIWSDVMAVQWSIMVFTLSMYGLYCWIWPSKQEKAGHIDMKRTDMGFKIFAIQAVLLLWSAGFSFYLMHKEFPNI